MLSILVTFCQTRDTLMKALSQDPTVFEYDTVYDDIQEHKKQTHSKQRIKESHEVCVLVTGAY